MAPFRLLPVCLALSLCPLAALSQLREIDRNKLPSEPAVQHAYEDLLPIEQYARIWNQKWPYSIPKAEVATRFTLAFEVLKNAQKANPDKEELRLLTALVGHLAYNLDVESAYTPALELLKAADTHDPRTRWFLGAHRCQSNDTAGGMAHFLAVEQSAHDLPADFWQDEFFCANASNMPAHGLRAYETAKRLGNELTDYTSLTKGLQERLQPASMTATYTNHNAWQAEKNGHQVRFASMMCGESFVIEENWQIDIPDVKNGNCAVTMSPPSYSARGEKNGATFVAIAQPAKEGETLENFLRRLANFDKPAYANAIRIDGIPCPAASCIAYEVRNEEMYPKQGGAHLLVLAFASEQPDYPGLVLEQPQAIPTAPGKTQFIRWNDGLRRFAGTRYTFIALDANEEIFARARPDFITWMKSMIIDTK